MQLNQRDQIPKRIREPGSTCRWRFLTIRFERVRRARGSPQQRTSEASTTPITLEEERETRGSDHDTGSARKPGFKGVAGSNGKRVRKARTSRCNLFNFQVTNHGRYFNENATCRAKSLRDPEYFRKTLPSPEPVILLPRDKNDNASTACHETQAATETSLQVNVRVKYHEERVNPIAMQHATKREVLNTRAQAPDRSQKGKGILRGHGIACPS